MNAVSPGPVFVFVDQPLLGKGEVKLFDDAVFVQFAVDNHMNL